MSNHELPEELHKPIIRKFEKRKVHSSFIDNIWGADHGKVKHELQVAVYEFRYMS